ncbi:hypothetical protein I4U23_031550 [Adineta vaga]|nr:hypothetical protein I4U23_031550 [Adineta vaga]
MEDTYSAEDELFPEEASFTELKKMFCSGGTTPVANDINIEFIPNETRIMAEIYDNEEQRTIDRVKCIAFREARGASAASITRQWVAEKVHRSVRFVSQWLEKSYDECFADYSACGRNLKCFNSAGGSAPNVYSTDTDKEITFHTNNVLYHLGVISVYMAKAPGKVTDFDGSGNVWFKIFEITAHADPAGNNYPTFPADTLHDAYYYSGAQFYIACAQLDVKNGGNGNP